MRHKVWVWIAWHLPRKLVAMACWRVYIAANNTKDTFTAFTPKNEISLALKGFSAILRWYERDIKYGNLYKANRWKSR